MTPTERVEAAPAAAPVSQATAKLDATDRFCAKLDEIDAILKRQLKRTVYCIAFVCAQAILTAVYIGYLVLHR